MTRSALLTRRVANVIEGYPFHTVASMSPEVAQRAKASVQLADLHIVGSSPECAVGIVENCVILYWRKEVVAAGSSWTRRAFLDLRRQRPNDKLAFFTVADAECSLATPPEIRKEVAELLKMYDKHLACAAITFEGRGFKMTMVRSVVTAINIASRTQFPNSVFADVDSAATWISTCEPRLRPAMIRSAVEQLRR
jgi:hypothetical protein